MSSNKLTLIDFSSAVKSSPINKNFSVIHDWMTRERLRTGGYGLVEGFGMAYDGSYNIKIASGILIDGKGEELIVPATQLACGAPTYEPMKEEELTVGENGAVKLQHAPYSPSMHRLIRKDSGHIIQISDDELCVKEEGIRLPIVSVDGRTVYVSEQFVGSTVAVEYKYSADRVDAILVDEAGGWHREIGINSTSPSVADYDGKKTFLIGFAHWFVKETGVDVEFIMDDRTYRKVYVDGMNRLFLNGKLYREPKFVYFEEPKNPEENDLWYDYGSNALSVYSNKEGVEGWRIVNDFTNVPLRSVKMWTEETCPVDLQTFRFGDDETNFRFIPGTHALDIIIDQQVVMEDQFEEIVQEGTKPYLSSGIGFKLKAPLDRPTVVQCVVHHTVKNGPLRNVFQRAAIFTAENFYSYTQDNTKKVFETDLPYVIGASQLEVFVDGKRLNAKDVTEMADEERPAAASDNGNTTKHFSVNSELSDGQEVTYKISRYVWSYDQLNQMVSEIEKKAEDALAKCVDFDKRLTAITANVADKVQNIEQKMKNLDEKIDAIEKSTRSKIDKVTLKDLSDDIRASLMKSIAHYEYNASLIGSVIYDCGEDDFVSVVCQNREGTTTLREGKEYSLLYKDGNAEIKVSAEWMSPNNTLFITLIRFGR